MANSGKEIIRRAIPDVAGEEVLRQYSNGAAYVEPTQLAGEHNIGQSDEFQSAVDESIIVTRVIGTTETVISSVPCLIFGIIVNATSTGTCSIRDAASTGTGFTPKAVVGVDEVTDKKDFVETKGAKMMVGCTVKGSLAATDITVLARTY